MFSGHFTFAQRKMPASYREQVPSAVLPRELPPTERLKLDELKTDLGIYLEQTIPGRTVVNVWDGQYLVRGGRENRVSVDVRFATPKAHTKEAHDTLDTVTRRFLNEAGLRNRHLDYDPGNYDNHMDAEIYVPPVYQK